MLTGLNRGYTLGGTIIPVKDCEYKEEHPKHWQLYVGLEVLGNKQF